MWALVGDLREGGMRTKIVWDAGEISGQPEGVAAMKKYAAENLEVIVVPPSPTMPVDLKDETSAYCVALAVLRVAELVAGEYPDFSWLPEGDPDAIY
jgi:hypothetical protein